MTTSPNRAIALVALASLAVLLLCLTTSLTTPGGCDVIHSNLSARLCAESVVGPGPVRLAVGLGVVAVLVLALSVVWRAERHRRLAGLLGRLAEPAVLGGTVVGVIDGVGPAYVAGLRHPQIYCASDLASQLDPVELHAVILHERHHQMNGAPARLVLLDAIAWPLGQLEVGRRWLARARAQIEIAADRYAVSAGATRADLASALLKLGDQNVPLGVAGYAAGSELRLRALLEDAPDLSSGGSRWIASGVVAGAVLLVCLLI